MTPFTNLESAIRQSLQKVEDPEIKRPITELGMVRDVHIDEHNNTIIHIDLTTSGCPLRTEIEQKIKAAVLDIPGIAQVTVQFGVMSDEQKENLRKFLRGNKDEGVIPFAQPQSKTRVFAIASGKGGVGKSTITVNLAIGFAARGIKVGIVDADIYGHSIPQMLGIDGKPTQLNSMIIPPIAQDIKVISIAQFTQNNTPVVWRGPMLHRALQQFLTDVFWGDLDVLFLDLPPGTGDIAISVAQLIPNSELLIVTTPQQAAAHVAERAGAIAIQTKQKVTGVIENMSAMQLPDGTFYDVFGSGGGQIVSDRLTQILGVPTPLLGCIPLDPAVRIAGDKGTLTKQSPHTMFNPHTQEAFESIIEKIIVRQTSLVGKSLGIDTLGKTNPPLHF